MTRLTARYPSIRVLDDERTRLPIPLPVPGTAVTLDSRTVGRITAVAWNEDEVIIDMEVDALPGAFTVKAGDLKVRPESVSEQRGVPVRQPAVPPRPFACKITDGCIYDDGHESPCAARPPVAPPRAS